MMMDMSGDEEENKGHPGMRRLRSLRDHRRRDQAEMEFTKKTTLQQQDLLQVDVEQENICAICNPNLCQGRLRDSFHRCRCSRGQKFQRRRHHSTEDKVMCPCNEKEVKVTTPPAQCKSRGRPGVIAAVNYEADENKESCSDRSRSLHRPTTPTTPISKQSEILVVTLSDTDEEEEVRDAKMEIQATKTSELDQDDAIEFMATPVLFREDEKVVFNPTFYINDGKYRVAERLGSGAYGNVYKIKDRTCGKMRALKVMRRDRTINPDDKESIVREINALTIIKNGNPPTCVVKVLVRLLQTFKLKNHLCIMYELLGPTLHDVMKHNNFKIGWNWKEIRQISYQMLVAINYLHSLELVHHDIKPENVCFAADYEIGCGMEPHVKLIDFGSTVNVHFRNGRIATTMRYRSPEIGLKGQCTFGADMWSLGCSFFEIYTGHPLFFPLDNNTNEVEKFYMMEAILCDVIPRRLAISSGLDCFDCDGNLKYNDENRPKIKEIHEQIKPLEEYNESPKSEKARHFFNLVKKLLAMKSSARIDSYTALHHPFFSNDKSHKEYEPIITPTSANLGAFLRKSSRPCLEMKDDAELRRLYGATRRGNHFNRLS